MGIARIADTHLSEQAPEWVALWRAVAARAVAEAAPHLNIELCDVTLDREPESDEVPLEYARICARPTSVWCLLGKRVAP
ncbi:MAG TPA: hypothetical protein VIY30_08970 [Burkholderiaceae bacterium]